MIELKVFNGGTCYDDRLSERLLLGLIELSWLFTTRRFIGGFQISMTRFNTRITLFYVACKAELLEHLFLHQLLLHHLLLCHLLWYHLLLWHLLLYHLLPHELHFIQQSSRSSRRCRTLCNHHWYWYCNKIKSLNTTYLMWLATIEALS